MSSKYKLNPKIEEILTDKRVALVGPSPYLIGSGMSKIIDSFDVVCRIRDILPKKDFRNDLGTRTDVIFYNCATISVPHYKKRLKEAESVLKDIKMMICPVAKGLGSDDWKSWPDDFIAPVVKNFANVNKYNIPFHWIGIPNYRILYNEVGVEPNTGTLAIKVLLKYKVKELFITGFSFYAEGSTVSKVYYPGYLLNGFEPNPKTWSPHKGHNQDIQKKHFINNILPSTSTKVIVDSYLNNLLSLNHKEVIKIK